MSRAQEISDQAAQWLLRREEKDWDDSDQTELENWLAQSDGHKAAFWRLKQSWREADRIGALGPRDGSDVSGHGHVAWWKPIAIAASLAIVIIATMISGGFGFRDPPATAKFDTPVGGRRIIPLADGSKVELNTASIVRTSMTAKSREVWLDKGEAYFEVAHRERLPFIVHAGSRTVTVLGTKFSVRRDGEKVTVSVVEGRVRVDEADEAQATRASIITAGDVAIGQGTATLVATHSDERVASALAWRTGMLSFDQSTLGEATAEFNRYNRRQIVITDPETANIRIGGTFPADDPGRFVRLLRDAYGLHIDDKPAQVKISG